MNTKTVVISAVVFFGTLSTAIAGPLCRLAPAGHDPRADQQPTGFALQQMGAVNNYLCGRFSCPNYNLWKNRTLSNAMASSNQNGYSIRYNARFMNGEVRKYGPLAAVGILAHELGHLIDFAQRRSGVSNADREATADSYAGCAFALAGHPESDLISLARSLHAMGQSPGYPSPDQRVQLVLSGYQRCR